MSVLNIALAIRLSVCVCGGLRTDNSTFFFFFPFLWWFIFSSKLVEIDDPAFFLPDSGSPF